MIEVKDTTGPTGLMSVAREGVLTWAADYLKGLFQEHTPLAKSAVGAELEENVKKLRALGHDGLMAMRQNQLDILRGVQRGLAQALGRTESAIVKLMTGEDEVHVRTLLKTDREEAFKLGDVQVRNFNGPKKEL